MFRKAGITEANSAFNVQGTELGQPSLSLIYSA
jgi:hypothetical protein